MDTNIIYIIAFLGVLGGVFYFFMIRPQRKRQQEHDQLTSQLKQGDSVITAGGIYGTIESLANYPGKCRLADLAGPDNCHHWILLEAAADLPDMVISCDHISMIP